MTEFKKLSVRTKYLFVIVTILMGAAIASLYFRQPASQKSIPISSDIPRITLSAQSSHLGVTWELSKPVKQFEFSKSAMPPDLRHKEWDLTTSEWVFDGQTLKRKDDKEFNSFSMKLSATSEFRDRYYTAVSKIGESGWVVFLNALAPEETSLRISEISFDSDTVFFGNGSHSKRSVSPDEDYDGFVYIGPKDYFSLGNASVIAGAEVPEWLSDEAVGAIQSSVKDLEKGFGLRVPDTPLIILTFDSNWPQKSLKGSVHQNTILLHIRGYDAADPSPGLLEYVINTAIHETTHLWNNSLLTSTNSHDQPWLHEGGSEYITNRFWMSDDKLRETAENALNRCLLEVGYQRSLQDPRAGKGYNPYHCGFVVNLIAELASQSVGDADIFDIWSAVFKASDQDLRQYSVESFLEAIDVFAGERVMNPLRKWVDGFSSRDEAELRLEMKRIGIELRPLTANSEKAQQYDLGNVLLRETLRGVCDGGFSYWVEPNHIRLETSNRCGPTFANNPNITSVNGISLLEDGAKAYFEVRDSCFSGVSMQITDMSGETLVPLECPDTISKLPIIYEVSILTALPRLQRD